MTQSTMIQGPRGRSVQIEYGQTRPGYTVNGAYYCKTKLLNAAGKYVADGPTTMHATEDEARAAYERTVAEWTAKAAVVGA